MDKTRIFWGSDGITVSCVRMDALFLRGQKPQRAEERSHVIHSSQTLHTGTVVAVSHPSTASAMLTQKNGYPCTCQEGEGGWSEILFVVSMKQSVLCVFQMAKVP